MDQNALRQFLGKYKHVLLILLLGIGLMLLPDFSKRSETPQPEQKAEVFSLQQQLTELLSQLEGAGRVQVLLTTSSGEKTVFQTETEASSDSKREKTVLVTDSGGHQAGLVCRIDPPTYLGAVVLCQGAENSKVRLAITEAVSNATGLGYHKISILKMK